MKKKQTVKQKEEAKYYGAIPPEILEDMTPEVRQQYFLWDEMLKRQIQLYPEMLLPLVREIFGKQYPSGINIKMLSTEYVVNRIYERGEKRMESVRSDLLIQVGSRDMYHMECQMKQGGDIAVRMLEYDMGIALMHGMEWEESTRKGKKGKHTLHFPKSAILYLDAAKKKPDTESCFIIFPDGTEYEYRIPILKVQRYTPEIIEEKRLNLLFPFTPIRFRRKFDAIWKEKTDPAKFDTACEKMEALKKDLTKFVADCIIIINREEENGTLGGIAGADIVEFMGKACDYLFSKEPKLLKEVHEIMEPAIKLFSEELNEQKNAELKLLSQELNQQKDAELKLLSQELSEQKDAELKLLSQELSEQKDAELKLLSQELNQQKDAELKLLSQELNQQKDAELKLLSEELNELKDAAIKSVRIELEAQIKKQQGELNEKDVLLSRQKEQSDHHIKNYVCQCKKEGKTIQQTEQMLQLIFSLEIPEAKEKLEKYW